MIINTTGTILLLIILVLYYYCWTAFDKERNIFVPLFFGRGTYVLTIFILQQ